MNDFQNSIIQHCAMNALARAEKDVAERRTLAARQAVVAEIRKQHGNKVAETLANWCVAAINAGSTIEECAETLKAAANVPAGSFAEWWSGDTTTDYIEQQCEQDALRHGG